MPAGICFREDTDAVTNNNSEFVPHFVKKNNNTRNLNFSASKYQKELRKLIYGQEYDSTIYNE